MPDWDSKTAVGIPAYSSLTYKVPEDGFIWFWIVQRLTNRPEITINGNSFYEGYESGDGSGNSIFLPVSKDDNVVVKNYHYGTLWFLKIKK